MQSDEQKPRRRRRYIEPDVTPPAYTKSAEELGWVLLRDEAAEDDPARETAEESA